MAESLVVFTVSTGGYDIESGSEPRLPKRAMPGVEFLRFVDEVSLAKLAGRSSRWRTILLNATDAPGGGGAGAAQRLSRDIKLRPHRYPAIWRHTASLYVDSNVRIHQPLWPVFAKVANGSADIAAIDCVSWYLANQCESAVRNLKVIGHTQSRPGLPLITCGDTSAQEISVMRDALTKAVDDVDEKSRAMLGICGLVPLDEEDYAPIAKDLERCGSISLSASPFITD